MERPSPTSDPTVSASALLRLPPELRNSIYNFVGDSGSKIVFDHGTLVAPHSALATACRQIRAEYLPMLREVVRLADTVEARIEGLESDDLIAFISSLPPPPKHTKRSLEVTLHFTKPMSSVTLDGLKRWLDALAGGLLQDYQRVREYKYEYNWDFWTVGELNYVFEAVREPQYVMRKNYRFKRWREACGADDTHPGYLGIHAIGAAANEATRQRLKDLDGSERLQAEGRQWRIEDNGRWAARQQRENRVRMFRRVALDVKFWLAVVTVLLALWLSLLGSVYCVVRAMA